MAIGHILESPRWRAGCRVYLMLIFFRAEPCPILFKGCYGHWAYPGVATAVPGISCLPDAQPGGATMVPVTSCLPDMYPGVATMVPGISESVMWLYCDPRITQGPYG